MSLNSWYKQSYIQLYIWLVYEDEKEFKCINKRELNGNKSTENYNETQSVLIWLALSNITQNLPLLRETRMHA